MREARIYQLADCSSRSPSPSYLRNNPFGIFKIPLNNKESGRERRMGPLNKEPDER